MRSALVVDVIEGIVLLLLIVLPRWRWHRGHTTPAVPKRTRAKREPPPFAGFTRQPECELCEPGMDAAPRMPVAPPPQRTFTRGRRRQVDTTGHFCPYTAWASHGRIAFGNSRANGHPNGRRGRQRVCLGGRGSVLATVGTPLHAKQVDPAKLGWAIAALAEGRGLRAVARVFAGDPHTGLGWLVEAAEPLETFTRSHWRALHVEQVQMDALFALLSAVKEGEGTEAEAIKRLARSPPWVWVAMAPVCKLMLAVAVGARTLAMAQRLGHQVPQGLAPAWAPLFLTDGLRAYLTALVPHDGAWMHPERRRAKGPQPQPRWLPVPGRLSAQGVKS